MITQTKTDDNSVRQLTDGELDLVQGAGASEAGGFLAVMLSAMYGGPAGLAHAVNYTIAK